MIKNEARTKWAILFLVALLIYEVSAGLEMTMLGDSNLYCKISDALKIVSIVTLLAGMATHFKYYSAKQWIIFGIFGVLCAICTYTSKSMAPVLFVAFWINMADVNIDDILRIYFVVISGVFIFAIVMTAIGAFPNSIFSDGGRCLGFKHPNGAAAAEICIILTYMGLRGEKSRWFEWVMMTGFAVVVFCFTHSNFGIIVSAVGIIVGLILNYSKNEKINKTIGIVGIAAGPFCAIICLTVAKVYTDKIQLLAKLNQILNGRLFLGTSGIENMGIKAFGQHIEWSTGNTINPVTEETIPYNIVDSSYINIPISYGWIFAVIIMLLYIAFAIYVYKKQQWHWEILLIAILVSSMVEGTLITIVCNPVLMAIGTVLFVNYLSKYPEESK